MENSTKEGKCPFNPNLNQSAGNGTKISDWWPNQLKLNILRYNSSLSDPMDANFDYPKEYCQNIKNNRNTWEKCT